MPLSQDHITAATPMGANLAANGATFRVWAPAAAHLYAAIEKDGIYRPDPADELVKNQATGHWTGFAPGVRDGTKYRYWVVTRGGAEGFKRDPWARELELNGYPDCDCIVRDPNSYPWHDQNYRRPAFHELIVYQLHIGVFFARDGQGNDIRRDRVAKFLDVLDRVEYLADLGVNAIQPLPVVEFQGEWSMGYNGSDLFSPEMDYCVGAQELAGYLPRVNALLARHNCAPLTGRQLSGQVNQLKALVDICHLHGIAVIPDVVYNHAGGGFDRQSIDHFDGENLYFSGAGWAGGRVFNFAKPEVREFLIGNARMFLEEYHCDGLRYDEVTVIDRNGGWSFCQDLNNTLDFIHPGTAQIAEYWGEQKWLGIWKPPAGMGFDIGYTDGIRESVRAVIAEAAGGASAHVGMGRLVPALQRPWNFPYAWQAYNCIENHDFVLDADGDHRKPRIAKMADWNDPRSWYARSRARVAMGLLLTAPGVPMIFMGQEFLEDKLWADNPHRDDLFLWWDGVEGQDRHMRDFRNFTRELMWLRRREPALTAEPVNVYHIDEGNRVAAFHRWVPEQGRDVVAVASLREESFYNHSYQLGFPLSGEWREIFNSDVYDNFFNPWVQGNPGGVSAGGPGMHGFAHSAGITIPANSILVFAK